MENIKRENSKISFNAPETKGEKKPRNDLV